MYRQFTSAPHLPQCGVSPICIQVDEQSSYEGVVSHLYCQTLGYLPGALSYFAIIFRF